LLTGVVLVDSHTRPTVAKLKVNGNPFISIQPVTLPTRVIRLDKIARFVSKQNISRE
jgi:hypothetical protein